MHEQYDMFGDEALVLVHDDEGGVAYHPGCVPATTAACWFDVLLPLMPWRSQRRPMYDRIVDVPRLTASVMLGDPRRPHCIGAALAAVRTVAPAPYTHVGLNLYRDGRDSVALHGDHVPQLVAGWPIAILSLGAPRELLIRARAGGVSGRVTLEPGSVLVMSHASQRTHEHGVPKCREAAGPRISLAFRVRRI